MFGLVRAWFGRVRVCFFGLFWFGLGRLVIKCFAHMSVSNCMDVHTVTWHVLCALRRPQGTRRE